MDKDESMDELRRCISEVEWAEVVEGPALRDQFPCLVNE